MPPYPTQYQRGDVVERIPESNTSGHQGIISSTKAFNGEYDVLITYHRNPMKVGTIQGWHPRWFRLAEFISSVKKPDWEL